MAGRNAKKFKFAKTKLHDPSPQSHEMENCDAVFVQHDFDEITLCSGVHEEEKHANCVDISNNSSPSRDEKSARAEVENSSPVDVHESMRHQLQSYIQHKSSKMLVNLSNTLADVAAP